MGKIFIPQLCLSRVNDYTEPMAIFTSWVKVYSAKYSVMQGLGKIFSGEKLWLYII